MPDNIIRTENNDPMVLSDEAAERLLAGAPWRRFAVLGDSIALGVGDPSPGYTASGWADRVAARLHAVNPEAAYLNTGRIGATSGQVRAEQLPAILEFQPDLAHIVCGGNDLLAGGDLRQVRDNLEELFGALARSGAQLSAFTVADVWDTERMAPMRAIRDHLAALNDIIRELAARHDAVLTEFWQHPLRLRADLMSADLVHFTTSGHAVVATEVVRSLSSHIPAARAPH